MPAVALGGASLFWRWWIRICLPACVLRRHPCHPGTAAGPPSAEVLAACLACLACPACYGRCVESVLALVLFNMLNAGETGLLSNCLLWPPTPALASVPLWRRLCGNRGWHKVQAGAMLSYPAGNRSGPCRLPEHSSGTFPAAALLRPASPPAPLPCLDCHLQPPLPLSARTRNPSAETVHVTTAVAGGLAGPLRIAMGPGVLQARERGTARLCSGWKGRRLSPTRASRWLRSRSAAQPCCARCWYLSAKGPLSGGGPHLTQHCMRSLTFPLVWLQEYKEWEAKQAFTRMVANHRLTGWGGPAAPAACRPP